MLVVVIGFAILAVGGMFVFIPIALELGLFVMLVGALWFVAVARQRAGAAWPWGRGRANILQRRAEKEREEQHRQDSAD